MQSEFTLYVPVAVSGIMTPFRLMVAVLTTPPLPSKMSVPTPAIGVAVPAGAMSNPLALCEKAPLRDLFVHPLFSFAFAEGNTPNAITATVAIVKIFAVM
ncbi:MAG TPA: hypothetical protein VGM43_11845 [Bryobacteraceae bacterium]